MTILGFTDYVQNGRGHGEVGQLLGDVRFDPGMLRPYFDRRGERCVTINTGRMVYDAKAGTYAPEYRKVTVAELASRGVYSPAFNATSLRKEDWIQMDKVIVKVARQRLKAWEDLAASNTYGGFDGMSRLTVEYEAMSDPGEAVVDMDLMSPARNDSPLFKLRSLPLPITHSDFFFSARRLAVSRNGGTPLDTTMAEAAGRRVAELVEKTVIGVETGITYGTQASAGYATHDGTSTIYGYTNFPARTTYTSLATPTGTNPEAVMANVIAMRELLYANSFFGPFMLYHSTGYDRYLDDDYFRSGSTAQTRTLRERIKSIEGIKDVRRLDYLTSGYQMIMVQMTPDVARAIVGMNVTTVQWEEKGGAQLNFKVMCIMVPQLRSNYNGVTGIVHGTTS